mmetsp:Transcript_88704/g.286611  ORF Transcript_88704/g.286611 Transcript_88704/m.286611 type:complete len:234 (+) Transcript_88704:1852-2553(+)
MAMRAAQRQVESLQPVGLCATRLVLLHRQAPVHVDPHPPLSAVHCLCQLAPVARCWGISGGRRGGRGLLGLLVLGGHRGRLLDLLVPKASPLDLRRRPPHGPVLGPLAALHIRPARRPRQRRGGQLGECAAGALGPRLRGVHDRIHRRPPHPHLRRRFCRRRFFRRRLRLVRHLLRDLARDLLHRRRVDDLEGPTPCARGRPPRRLRRRRRRRHPDHGTHGERRPGDELSGTA